MGCRQPDRETVTWCRHTKKIAAELKWHLKMREMKTGSIEKSMTTDGDGGDDGTAVDGHVALTDSTHRQTVEDFQTSYCCCSHSWSYLIQTNCGQLEGTVTVVVGCHRMMKQQKVQCQLNCPAVDGGMAAVPVDDVAVALWSECAANKVGRCSNWQVIKSDYYAFEG